MIEIQPVQIGLPLRTANYLRISALINSTRAETCVLFYEILGSNGNDVLTSGNMSLTESQYDLWGCDNSYIENIVMNYLGVVPYNL